MNSLPVNVTTFVVWMIRACFAMREKCNGMSDLCFDVSVTKAISPIRLEEVMKRSQGDQ